MVLPLAPCNALRDPDADEPYRGRELLGRERAGGHGSGGDHHGHGPSPLKRLLGLLRLEVSRDLGLVVAYAVGVGILSLATPLAIEAVVTTVALNLLLQQLIVLTLILFGCLALAALLRVLQTYMVELVQRRLFVRVAADLAYRLPRVRIDAYDRSNGPELVNRFFDVMTVQKVAALLLLDGISVVLGAGIGLVVLAFYHPFLLGFDLVLLLSMTLIIWLLGRGAVTTSIQESIAKYQVAGGLEEIARVPLAYKVDGGADFAVDRTDAATRRYLSARRRHFVILMRQIVFALGLQAVASSALLGLGGYLVIREQLTLGQLVAAELIVATVLMSFTKLGKHLEAWYDLMAAIDKLGVLVDLPLERSDGEVHRETGVVGAALKVKDISYGYDPHHPVVRHLDLEIKPGERLAVIGPSGSGKSTLVDLIYGLRQPTSGTIELDGVNTRDLRLESLRAEVAVVKGLEVIEDTILENVRMGRLWLSLVDVRQALESAGLLEEVARLPDGMQTVLSSKGAPLSVGQTRRLMLARAIVGDPRLLVIDEGLDGLDLDARRRLMDTLFDRSAPWSLLIVSHSQEVVAQCDRVVILADGHVEHTLEPAPGRMRDIEGWLQEAGLCRLN
ncbi:ABC transporter ATP-binding protein [Tautonia sociabilis]|uniref:ABC transporter ATP-binding protein n=2 Tax=Tautonia sociabilis TaxID=2080755 RepID=A0A432MN55_9BACT|nr:ABC transporter ATP-binding protein [Tautonia sociabilis]